MMMIVFMVLMNDDGGQLHDHDVVGHDDGHDGYDAGQDVDGDGDFVDDVGDDDYLVYKMIEMV